MFGVSRRAFNCGLLKGLSGFVGTGDYPITGEAAAVLLYTALSGRLCVSTEEVGEVDPHLAAVYPDPYGYDTCSITTTVLHSVYSKDISGRDIVRGTCQAGRVPFHTFHIETKKKLPVIVYLHGTLTCIDTCMNIEIGSRLAEEGFFVVAPELYANGARMDDPIYKADEVGEIVPDVDVVLEYVRENCPQADLSRLGICGFSLGAMFSMYYTVKGTYHPVAAATCAGAFDIRKTWEPGNPASNRAWMPEGTNMYSVKTGVVVDHEITKEYCIASNEKHCPYNQRENMLDVALLLQHGNQDALGNFDEDNGKLFEYLKSQPQDVFADYKVQKGLDHSVSIEELDNWVPFFKKWLKA